MVKRTIAPKPKAAKKPAAKKAAVKASEKEKDEDEETAEDGDEEQQPTATDEDQSDDEQPAAEDDGDEETDEDGEAEPAVGAEGDDEKTKAVKTRVASILNHPEAKGREELAKNIALNTNLSVAAAGSMLATAPRAKGTENPLKKSMADVQNPKVAQKAASADDSNPIVAATKAVSPSRLAK